MAATAVASARFKLDLKQKVYRQYAHIKNCIKLNIKD
jgi:hypothetical protein